VEFWDKILGRMNVAADTSTSGDLLAALPPQSRAKLERLTGERADARAILRNRSDAMLEANENHGRAQSEAQRALTNLAPPPRGTTTEEMVARIEADGNRHKAARDKAAEAQKRAEEAVRAFDFLSDVETWLATYARSGGKLAYQELPRPTLGVEAIRRKLDEVLAAWEAAENAPAPKSDYLERALAEVNALADAGKLILDMRNRGPNPLGLRDRLSISLSTIELPPLTKGGAPERHTALHGATEHAAFLAWLYRDAIVARVTEEIEKVADDGALSHSDRETRFAKLAQQRLDLERLEEAAILRAAASGQAIPRRRGADPRAVLEVREV
jgi:hypothetical protein